MRPAVAHASEVPQDAERRTGQRTRRDGLGGASGQRHARAEGGRRPFERREPNLDGETVRTADVAAGAVTKEQGVR